jgi:hypothetical protein
MDTITRLLTLAIFTLLPMVAQSEGYVCTQEMVTGFAQDKNDTWRQGRFQPDQQFIVRPATESERTLSALRGERNAINNKWVVQPLGLDLIAVCPGDFKPDGHLVCRGVIEEFRMNKNSLRFLWAYLSGYWDATPGHETSDTPTIAIGKCVPM